MPESKRNGLSSYVDELQASGRYTFRREDLPHDRARSAIGIEASLRRLKKKARVVSPKRGFFVIIPLEYRAAGSLPASWFVHDLMEYLSQPYYVGLLSAASLHGAAHQQPMVFQVITDRPTRKMEAGRNRIEFHMSSSIESNPVVEMQTETGSMRVSTPETTAFDLVRFPAASGHLSNVSTVLGELAEVMEAGALAEQADRVRTPDVQRLGYLLDYIGEQRLADPLAEWLSRRQRRAVRLRPDGKREARPLDQRWHILPNEILEVEL